MRKIDEQTKTAPVLCDVAIEAMKEALLTLPWLDQAFGRAWPIPMKRGERQVTEPCVYTKGDDYETLVPSSDLGNYSFIVLMDAARIDEGKVRQPFALVVWYDMRRCFDDGQNRRDTENLKKDVIDAVSSATVRNGGVTLNRIMEMPKAVYKEFTFDTQNQALVQPFGAMRFEGEISMMTDCYE